jgi:hypothetical protein
VRRAREQTGQTAAEYLGALVVVAVIIFVVGTSDAGAAIRDHMREIVCRIAGGNCPGPEERKAEEPSKCIVSQQSDKVTIKGDVNVRMVKIKLEGGVEYVRQKRADGKVAITVKLPLKKGVGPGLKSKLGKIPGLDGEVYGTDEASVTFLADNDQQANRFAAQLKETTAALAAGPIAARVLGLNAHVDPLPVGAVQFQHTTGANVSYDGDAGGFYGKGKIDISSAVAIRHDLEAGGDTTIFYKPGAITLEGEAGALFGGRLGGSGEAEVQVAVTVDKHGSPKNLRLQGAAQAELLDKLKLSGKDMAKVLKQVGEQATPIEVTDGSGRGKRVEWQLDLPLDDPRVRRAALAFLQGVDPETGQQVDRTQAASELARALREKAKFQVRTYDTTSSNSGGTIDLGVGGVGGTVEGKSAELTGAYDYVPGQGMVPSATCRRGAPGSQTGGSGSW